MNTVGVVVPFKPLLGSHENHVRFVLGNLPGEMLRHDLGEARYRETVAGVVLMVTMSTSAGVRCRVQDHRNVLL